MKDLRLKYIDIYSNTVTKEYDTIFDFLDKPEEREKIKDVSGIKFTLFENSRNSGKVENVDDLITHLENIMK